jgi:copper(I)-binding protein
MPIRHAAALAAVLGVVAVAGMSGLAAAHDYKAGALVIQHPWTRATPPRAEVAGGYVTVVNHGKTADRLIGGSLSAASGFALHDMSMKGGIMRMRATGPLTIPAGGSLTLSPSGKHAMFTGLKHALKKGQRVAGTLVFEHAGTVPVQFTVEGLAAKAPDGGSGTEGMESHPGFMVN